MMIEEFRGIPGYQAYGVSKAGIIKSLPRDLILTQYLFNGYCIVDTFRGSLTETLPVHRAVALAWVENPKPEIFNIVNHKDGVKINNWWENLEWTDQSGNNFHAVNTGLRRDNIPCRVRNVYTGEVSEFMSRQQAAVFMGLAPNAPPAQLLPKKFGALVAEKFEFRHAQDDTSWFYENRTKIVAARFMTVVRDLKSGEVKEYFSAADLLKEFQLYRSPSKSVFELAKFGNETIPDKEFVVKDSYAEKWLEVKRQTKTGVVTPVIAVKGDRTIKFDSLTQCASHFNVFRTTIMNRLDNGKQLDGWTFMKSRALQSEMVEEISFN